MATQPSTPRSQYQPIDPFFESRPIERRRQPRFTEQASASNAQLDATVLSDFSAVNFVGVLSRKREAELMEEHIQLQLQHQTPRYNRKQVIDFLDHFLNHNSMTVSSSNHNRWTFLMQMFWQLSTNDTKYREELSDNHIEAVELLRQDAKVNGWSVLF